MEDGSFKKWEIIKFTQAQVIFKNQCWQKSLKI